MELIGFGVIVALAGDSDRDISLLLAITSKGHSEIGSQVLDLDIRCDVDDVFSLGLGLDEHLILAHDLDHLPDVAARLLEKLQLLPEQADARIEIVPLGFQAAQILSLAVDGVFSDLYLGLEEVLEDGGVVSHI